jgi:hypothetical protein
MMKLKKYSFGVGDRFGHQGIAQLSAIIEAQNNAIDITRFGTNRTASIKS